MNQVSSIAVLTHNPNGKWGDVRPLIEQQGYYEKWNKSLNLEVGKKVLIYISGNVRKIEYIMEVIQVHNDSLDLKLVQKLDEKQSQLLSYELLKQNGLKQGTINYILDKNPRLYDYIQSVLNEHLPIKRQAMQIKNIILYGAPGVGKTHNYKNLISMIEEGKSQNEIFETISKNLHVSLDNETFETIKKEKRVEFVTFHQSYSYEDFIEGFRPNESGNIELKDGIFKSLCHVAEESNKNFYIVIDEINRGNISKIFGELITLIEEDKRDIYEVTLPYSKEKFKVPSNLYIIATMNSTDKSIATIDIALRRRFTFLKMKPNEDLVHHVGAKVLFNALNGFIKEKLSEDYMLGHSYFMNIQNDEDLQFVKEYKIKPLLEEYFYADDESYQKAEEILNKDNLTKAKDE